MKKIFLGICTIALIGTAQGQIVISSLFSPYVQDFDTLSGAGTSSAVPAAWAFTESGANTDTTYRAGAGTSTTGDTYSFGSAASTERALGGLRSGSLIPTIGAQFRNSTGQTLTDLAISYTGEQWRLGALDRVDRLIFALSLDATSLTSMTWVNLNALDFVAPVTGPTVGALDGNAPANQTLISQTISGLNIPNDATFWIRWTDFDATGSDDGLAVDNFQLVAVPEPGASAAAAGLCLLGFAAYRRFLRRA